MAVHAPEQLIGGIDFLSLRIVRAALLIGAGEHHQTMELLDRPTLFHKTRGQIIEQFGMSRRIGPQTEIARGPDQWRAEMIHPNAIDEDARSQRIVRIDDRFG